MRYKFIVEGVMYYIDENDKTQLRRCEDDKIPTSQRAIALKFLEINSAAIQSKEVNTHRSLREVLKYLLASNIKHKQPIKRTFRNSASFGKRIEYYIIGLMLKEGLDVYIPMVDDDGIDAIIRKEDGSYIEVQIKARSKTVVTGDAALFAAIRHDEYRLNHNIYFYVFYSERLDKIWILSGDEFVKEAVQNKTGKNKGKRSLWFNGKKQGVEYSKEKYNKYLTTNFSRFK